jgi:phosphomannomutase
MANELIVSVSGIRGIVGEGLTAEAACAFAAALGTHVNGGSVALSRDGRPSGLVLRHAVLAGLLEAGCDVIDLGVTPTPSCGLATRRLRAAGAIQITASHNPAPWNGLKLFGSDGRVLSAAEGKKVQGLFESRAFRRAAWDRLGTLSEERRADDWHRDRVLELVDVTRIRARAFRVLLDANGGAGGPLGRRLLEGFQAQPIVEGGNADGFFQHEPEPIAQNLTAIGPLVSQRGADMGFVLDPDADRLALIDETGCFLGEELTLALAVQFRLRHERGPVVVNMSTSRVVEDICKQAGAPFHRAAVGEANVADKMIEVGAVIGGEGNGGVIDPRVGYVRDPFIGMGLILNLMAESGKKLSELAAELPVYHIVKEKYTVAREGLTKLFEALPARWPEAAVNRVDGLRLDWKDRWVHVRPSNTEPVVRVIAEAPGAAEAEQLCRDVRDAIDQQSKSSIPWAPRSRT